MLPTALAATLASALAAPPPLPDAHLKLDQFGYLTTAPKVAVLSDPRSGYNAPDPYTPGATLEVRRWRDDSVAWSGPAQAWRAGATHAPSGDGAWWVDFSALTEPGTFYLFDPAVGLGSGAFEIGDDVYRSVLRHALRSFFYQRCGQDRAAIWAGAGFADPACHLGAEQDRDCRAVLDPRPATALDLSGGWHDAGDYNKYINFADDPVHDLLSAYEQNPRVWTDDLDLPESGNCVPDLLDEVKWELDWFLRMQLPDGSVLHKVSVTDFAAASPPSADLAPRRHAPPTASATVSLAGALAHAAVVYRGLADPGMQAYALTLEQAALAAWDWLEANPGQFPSSYANQGFQNAAAEDDAYAQDANRVCAAVYLYAATADPRFRSHVDLDHGNVHLLQWGFAYPFEPQFQDCLLYYTALPGATPATVSAIQDAYRTSMQGADNLGHVTAADDPYRAWLADGNYTWGSNRTKSSSGTMYRNMLVHGLDAPNAALYLEAAAGYLHYLHGVNPVGLVYLSAMEPSGAERSVSEFYHSWFHDGTPWDSAKTSLIGPAPGFLPGGPNPSFAPDPSYSGPPLVPPQVQPAQKSYRDWNAGWPENSWEVTENQLAYQAAYLKLLAGHLAAAPQGGGAPASPGNSLRAARSGADVVLSWSAAARATSYEIERCDAAVARPCAPAVHATSSATSFTDAAAASSHLWYTLAAVNACGRAE